MLWKQESFVVLRPLQSEFFRILLGMLAMDIPHLKRTHVVAVDELGVVDPADNAPDHVPLRDYVYSRNLDGVVFHKEWLAVRKRPRT